MEGGMGKNHAAHCDYLMAGAPYAEAMRPYAGAIAERARGAKTIRFLVNFRIAAKGKTI